MPTVVKKTATPRVQRPKATPRVQRPSCMAKRNSAADQAFARATAHALLAPTTKFVKQGKAVIARP